jgi:CRP-like cAMP-binding protein
MEESVSNMQLIDTELFKNIERSSLAKLEKCLRVHVMHYKKNETVCSYGSGSDRIGIVLTGRAAISRTDYNGYESLLETLPEGAIFSESMSYARTAGDSIMVRCTVRSSIAYLDYDMIRSRCAEKCEVICPEADILHDNLMSMLINRAKQLSERVEVLGCHSMREKLLCYFRLQLKGEETGKLELPFSWMELASYINADRSAMMRELSLMKTEGIIHTDGRKVTVLKKFSEE